MSKRYGTYPKDLRGYIYMYRLCLLILFPVSFFMLAMYWALECISGRIEPLDVTFMYFWNGLN